MKSICLLWNMLRLSPYTYSTEDLNFDGTDKESKQEKKRVKAAALTVTIIIQS